MEDLKPKVRLDLSFDPLHHEGQNVFVVQDSLGIISEPICLTELAGMMLSVMDGTRTLDQIQALFVDSAGGQAVPDNFVRSHYEQLCKMNILDTPEYREKKKRIFDDYSGLEVREHSHAEAAYESDPQNLRNWIDLVLDDCQDPEPSDGAAPTILVAPHIDFRVNEKVYGKAYRRIRNRSYDRVVLMGTGHSIPEGVYCPTRKDFSTPLGVSKCDRGAVESLGEAVGSLGAGNDFPHRGEHALEFQLIFLQHLLGIDDFEIVPILCGSLLPYYGEISRLRELEEARPFLEALGNLVSEDGRKTLVVAGVDLSHIGQRFSHPVPAREMMEETQRHDRDLIEAFCAGDAETFWDWEAKTEGKYNVCGFSTLATILDAANPAEGKTLAYDFWDDHPTGSAVTFAALEA